MRIYDYHQAAQYSKRAKAMTRGLNKIVSPDHPDGGSEYKRLARRVLSRLRARERFGRVLAVTEPSFNLSR